MIPCKNTFIFYVNVILPEDAVETFGTTVKFENIPLDEIPYYRRFQT